MHSEVRASGSVCLCLYVFVFTCLCVLNGTAGDPSEMLFLTALWRQTLEKLKYLR